MDFRHAFLCAKIAHDGSIMGIDVYSEEAYSLTCVDGVAAFAQLMSCAHRDGYGAARDEAERLAELYFPSLRHLFTWTKGAGKHDQG